MARKMFSTLEEQFDEDFHHFGSVCLPYADRLLLLGILNKIVEDECLPANTYPILSYWAHCVHGREEKWCFWGDALYIQFNYYNDDYPFKSEWSFDTPRYIQYRGENGIYLSDDE